MDSVRRHISLEIQKGKFERCEVSERSALRTQKVGDLILRLHVSDQLIFFRVIFHHIITGEIMYKKNEPFIIHLNKEQVESPN